MPARALPRDALPRDVLPRDALACDALACVRTRAARDDGALPSRAAHGRRRPTGAVAARPGSPKGARVA